MLDFVYVNKLWQIVNMKLIYEVWLEVQWTQIYYSINIRMPTLAVMPTTWKFSYSLKKTQKDLSSLLI